MKTVLPERLRPVTASHTVEPARSGRLIALASRSDASTTTGGSQLMFTMGIGLDGPLPAGRAMRSAARMQVGVNGGGRKWTAPRRPS